VTADAALMRMFPLWLEKKRSSGQSQSWSPTSRGHKQVRQVVKTLELGDAIGDACAIGAAFSAFAATWANFFSDFCTWPGFLFSATSTSWLPALHCC